MSEEGDARDRVHRQLMKRLSETTNWIEQLKLKGFEELDNSERTRKLKKQQTIDLERQAQQEETKRAI